MSTLFMVNVPHNCSDEELTQWVQSSGIEVAKVRQIRDLVSGASPSFAYVDITERMSIADAVQKLNGHNIRERVVIVSEARKKRSAVA
jgi:RNA recognition motif-containing protein